MSSGVRRAAIVVIMALLRVALTVLASLASR
jgi:hypothetical protein